MKRFIIALSLVVALPLVARAETKETWINGRTVTVITEATMDTPAACQAALDKLVDQQGWHDHIFRALDGNKAFMIYSQRDDSHAATTKEVKVTLWKAFSREGKTYTETWIYHLSPTEVNRFLDAELPAVAEQFKSSPVHYTITVS